MRYLLFFITLFITFVYTPAESAGPDGYISIPSIGLYKSVGFIPDSDPSPDAHFYDLTELNYGVARLEHMMWNNTSGGRTVIVGHTPGGFGDLEYVGLYDRIVMLMDGQEYEFEIFSIYSTHKSDNSIFDAPTDAFELVLITCINDTERLIVKAR